jgi:hypothetical protein
MSWLDTDVFLLTDRMNDLGNCAGCNRPLIEIDHCRPLLPKRDDLPRGSQEEGRRHGGRRPIKVYAFTLMPATVRLEFGGRGFVAEAWFENTQAGTVNSNPNGCCESSLDLFD